SPHDGIVGVACAFRRLVVPDYGDLCVNTTDLVIDFTVAIYLQYRIIDYILFKVVGEFSQSRDRLELAKGHICGPAPGVVNADIMHVTEHLVRKTFPLDQVNQVGGDVNDALPLLGNIHKPWWPGKDTTRYVFEKVMHAFLGDSRLLRGSLLQFSEDILQQGEFSLKYGGNLITLRHDVVQQQIVLVGHLKRLCQRLKVAVIDHHRFVGKYVKTGFKRPGDVLCLFLVVARQYHYVAWLILDHTFEEIASGVYFFLPLRRRCC